MSTGYPEAWLTEEERKARRNREERDEAIRILYRLERDRMSMGEQEPVHRLDPALAQVRAFLRRAAS